MGLILDARSSYFFPESVAYGKAGALLIKQNAHSGLLLWEDTVLIWSRRVQKLCQKG